MAKHTKGPWAWQAFGPTHSLAAQHGMREIIIGATKEKQMGYPIVAMNQDGILQAVDPEHPNAKLIAAAPALHEALSALVELKKHKIVNGKDDKYLNEQPKAWARAKEILNSLS